MAQRGLVRYLSGLVPAELVRRIAMTEDGIGAPLRRREDKRFLTGRGRYVSDIDRPDQAHAAFVYSPHAHAIIRSIDIAAAQAMPGVIAVLTGRDWLDDDLGTIDPEIKG